ncbi:YeeE/YedE family protein [Oceanibium sediminis]|uniref:YeeE/YedE family protein n=1 Tax=Oceanibium sediminis TaxID=2026339 RepID=UPI000DD3D494|nr:YeeE/YedE family protein [Oceanibium sediminis]
MGPVFAALSGLIFGLGLIVSGMINPAKVLNFLDIAGQWDPSLAFVMAGAIAVTLPGYRLVHRRSGPMLHPMFHLPTRQDLDRQLIGGSAIFGLGWGIAGLCPGPAMTALPLMEGGTMLFTTAMLIGIALASYQARAPRTAT